MYESNLSPVSKSPLHNIGDVVQNLDRCPSTAPLRFSPYLRPQPWGFRRFATTFSRALPGDCTYGESWELSTHPRHLSRVSSGPHADMTILQLWEEYGHDWWGPVRPQRFPWLVKFLDCHEQLSIQVHPSDELALKLHHEDGGKTEAWVVLDAGPDSRIYAGFSPGVTADDLDNCLSNGTLSEILHSFVPKIGDCIFIPAGTVHGCGGGLLLAEVQQTSDATFRLFDWNRLGLDGRPRPLQIPEARAAIDWKIGPVSPLTPVPQGCYQNLSRSELLVDCEFFRWERHVLNQGESQFDSFALSAWICTEGTVNLTHLDEHQTLHRGETVLIPPSKISTHWTTNTTATLLRVTPPVTAVSQSR